MPIRADTVATGLTIGRVERAGELRVGAQARHVCREPQQSHQRDGADQDRDPQRRLLARGDLDVLRRLVPRMRRRLRECLRAVLLTVQRVQDVLPRILFGLVLNGVRFLRARHPTRRCAAERRLKRARRRVMHVLDEKRMNLRRRSGIALAHPTRARTRLRRPSVRGHARSRRAPRAPRRRARRTPARNIWCSDSSSASATPVGTGVCVPPSLALNVVDMEASPAVWTDPITWREYGSALWQCHVEASAEPVSRIRRQRARGRIAYRRPLAAAQRAARDSGFPLPMSLPANDMSPSR